MPEACTLSTKYEPHVADKPQPWSDSEGENRSLATSPFGAGLRVWGSGFRVQGSGSRIQGSGFRAQG